MQSIETPEQLYASPGLGASWEEFALECVCRTLGKEDGDLYFWNTHAGAELDLFWQARGQNWGVEFKYEDAPRWTRSKAEVEKNIGEALATLPPEPISFTLYFEEGSTVVVEDSKSTMLELFAEVAKRQAVEVQVTGHTDTVGRESDNDRLSGERAQAVKEMLIAQGLKSTFIRVVGRGERELLVPTPDNVREPRNRRVEVIVR